MDMNTVPEDEDVAKPQKPVSDLELKAIIDAQIHASMGYIGGDLSEQRSLAMDYYLGEPFGDEVEGRSKVVSTDVADVIEWILPSLLRTFFATDEAVRFDPVDEDDIEQAEQETDYVNYVFSKQNPGFLIFYTWFKDALLQKNGVVKSYWEKTKKETRAEYKGLTEDQVMLLMQDPNLKPIAQSQSECIEMVGTDPNTGAPIMQPKTVYDVVFKRTSYKGQVRIENIPPEHYFIVKNHNSVDPKTATFVGMKADKTATELAEMGIEQSIIDRLPSAQEGMNTEDIARNNLSDEQTNFAEGSVINSAMRMITVYECYLYVDRDGDGIPELRKVLKAGNEILIDEEVDSIPFDVITPIILTHKHYGLSIADLIMDLQLIKSTIWRQMLDNMYLINNGRHVVNENTVNLDDLLTSRPGGIVRTTGNPGMDVVPLITQPLNQGAFQMVEYIDSVREGRTGVSQTTMGLNDDLLSNNKGDASVSRMMTAATQRIELIARIFAETGVKSLFLSIHELLLKNQDQSKVVQLRNKWVPVNPSEWQERTEMTINVGLGTGERDQLIQAMMMLQNFQEKALQYGGKDIIVSLKNIYNAAKDMSKYAGVRNVDLYLTDPDSEAAKQAMQQQAQQAAQQPNELQIKAKLDAEKNQIAMQKQQLDYQAKIMQLEQDKAKMQADAQLQMIDMQRKLQEQHDYIALELTKAKHQHRPEHLTGAHP